MLGQHFSAGCQTLFLAKRLHTLWGRNLTVTFHCQITAVPWIVFIDDMFIENRHNGLRFLIASQGTVQHEPYWLPHARSSFPRACTSWNRPDSLLPLCFRRRKFCRRSLWSRNILLVYACMYVQTTTWCYSHQSRAPRDCKNTACVLLENHIGIFVKPKRIRLQI